MKRAEAASRNPGPDVHAPGQPAFPEGPPPSEKWTGPLPLLIRINLLQSWRRLKSIRDQSRLLSTLIFLFVTGYFFLAFWLFLKGLRFLSTFPGLGTVLIERLLFLLFAFLFVLLLVSNLVISYTNFFRNRETSFLLPLPLSYASVYRFKFIESLILASWAFLFLIAPLLAAYGLEQRVAWHFYLMTLVLISLFIVLPAVIGAWIALNIARFLDRRTFQTLVVGGGILLVLLGILWLRPETAVEDVSETRVLAVLDRLLVRTRFAQYPLLPSFWLSNGVLQWADGALAAAMFFTLVLLSNVLLFGFLSFTWLGAGFYRAFSTFHSRGAILHRALNPPFFSSPSPRFDYTPGWPEKAARMVPGLRRDVRALILKDALMFWRDTTQWGQTLVLFGLLAAYIINLRHFSQQLTNPFWVQLVSHLNLGACSLNLATLTTRFVYPQFSLEGKRLWIVGLAPLGLIRVLDTKFRLATIASLSVTASLMLLSCRMLKMPWDRTAYFVAVVMVMTFTLNALAVGLGALYPNFKEDNPSKIVSGFGGTFCLVLSFVYIVASVSLLALASPWYAGVELTPRHVVACWAGFALLSLFIGLLPLQLAFHRVKSFEI